MANTSSIVGRSCSPMCTVHNATPPPPTQAPVNMYPGRGPAKVNTEPGVPQYQVRTDKSEFPEYVLPKGQTL